MDNQKRWWALIGLMYFKIIVGIVITFYPFKFNSPYREIIALLGVVIILTSGIKVRFSHDFTPITKPD